MSATHHISVSLTDSINDVVVWEMEGVIHPDTGRRGTNRSRVWGNEHIVGGSTGNIIMIHHS